MESAIDQMLLMQDTMMDVHHRDVFYSARAPSSYIMQRRPTDPNGRFLVQLAQRHTLLTLIPKGKKAGIMRRGQIENCQALVLEQLLSLLLNR